MPWTEKHSRPATLFNRTAGIHYGHAVGKSGQQGWIVSDEDERRANGLIEVSQYSQNLGLYGYIQRSGRFVGNDQIWPAS